MSKILYYYNDQLINPGSKHYCPNEIKTFLNYEIAIKKHDIYYIGVCDNSWKEGADNKNLLKRISYAINNTLKEIINKYNITKDEIIVKIIATHDTGYEALQYERLILRNNKNKYPYNNSNGREKIASKNSEASKIYQSIVYKLMEKYPEEYKNIINELKEEKIVK